MGGMTIGQAAREAGVGVETLRFYEREGLIDRPPKPAGGGFRAYTGETVRRVRFIREAQRVGFALREVKELLALRAAPGAGSGDVRARALAKHGEISREIARRARMRELLERLIRACPGGEGLEGCSILEEFESGSGTKTGRRREVMANSKRKVEVFSAGCPVCEAAVEQVRAAACPSCEVSVVDMRAPGAAERAARLGVRAVPAVVIDGRLAGCCEGGGPGMAALRAAGLGQPI
ncbi:MAG: MerR family transcriptional regulator [Nitrospinota bacterium]